MLSQTTENCKPLNSMCSNCVKLGNDCKGTTCQTWTGCVYKKPARKMSELCTGRYSDPVGAGFLDGPPKNGTFFGFSAGNNILSPTAM